MTLPSVRSEHISIRDAILAAFVAIVWGLSFLAIKIGVSEMPPLMFSALRFALAAVPAVFFIPAPKTRAWIVIGYGLAIGVVQFGLLFLAIRLGMPAGLSSLVIQLQVFFTILLAWFGGERPTAAQSLGALLGFGGVVVIGSQRLAGAELLPFVLVVLAGLSWAVGNLVGKRAGRVDMLAFTVWSSLAAPLPLFVLSVLFEGKPAVAALLHPTWSIWIMAVVLAYVATLFGFGVWSNLLSRYPAATVAPFALLVPVVGMAASTAAFGERVSRVEFLGAGLVLAGLACTLWGGRVARILRPPPAS